MGQVRNVLLILAITAGMAVATVAVTIVFDILPDTINLIAIHKG